MDIKSGQTSRQRQYANIYIKIHRSLFIIREPQFKANDIPTHLLEWSHYKKLTISNSGEDAEQQKTFLIVGGIAEWHVFIGRHFGSLRYRIKHNISIQF